MRYFLIISCMVVASSAASAEMKASFAWGETKKCFDSKSPPFKISGIPAGTKKLVFAMRDLDAPDFYHGGGSVEYKGKGDIPYGAFKYKGPCPPTPHTYQFTIKAVDAGGKELSSTKVRKRFP